LEQEDDDSELEDAEDRAQQELADQIQRDMTASPAPSVSEPQAPETYIASADDPVPQDSRKRIEYAARLLKKVTSLPKVSPQLTGASNYRQWGENMVNMLDINFLMEIWRSSPERS
jgi:hypothetical protein